MRSGSGAAAAGGGAGWGSGSSYCWAPSPWLDQRSPCRRETRLLTAVAVPAATATRATPRSSPGMVISSRSGGGFHRVQRREDCLDGDAAASDELAAGATEGRGDRRRPAVLPDDHDRRGPGLERLAGGFEVL